MTTLSVFSPRLIQGMVGGHGLWSKTKAFGLFPFPHQTKICSEGLQGRHALSMLGRTLIIINILCIREDNEESLWIA